MRRGDRGPGSTGCHVAEHTTVAAHRVRQHGRRLSVPAGACEKQRTQTERPARAGGVGTATRCSRPVENIVPKGLLLVEPDHEGTRNSAVSAEGRSTRERRHRRRAVPQHCTRGSARVRMICPRAAPARFKAHSAKGWPRAQQQCGIYSLSKLHGGVMFLQFPLVCTRARPAQNIGPG